MGLTGALSSLSTAGEASDEPSAKSRKVSVAGNKAAFAMFQAIDQKPPEKSAKELVIARRQELAVQSRDPRLPAWGWPGERERERES